MKITTKRISAIDLGSNSIKMAVADIDETSKIPIVRSFVKLPSKGIRNGMVIDIEAAASVIKEAKQILEQNTNSAIENCFVSVSGDHITGINTSGRIQISKEHTIGLGEPDKITHDDINRVIEHTRGYALSSDREIMHLFPIEYIIDERAGITNPEGLSGRRLQVNAHLTTYEVTAVENINSVMEKAGIPVAGFILQALASATATLDNDEMQKGVVLMDIGADVTDIIVYYNNAVYYTGTINSAGSLVTSDLSILTGITKEYAEKIKLEYGYATHEVITTEETYNIEGINDRKSLTVTNTELAKYINARLTEILHECQKEALNSNITQNLEPVVCLCGGTSMFRGFEEVADHIFSSSPLAPNVTRIGIPTGFSGSNMKELSSPEYATLIGLLKYGTGQKSIGLRTIVKQSINVWDKMKKLMDKF